MAKKAEVPWRASVVAMLKAHLTCSYKTVHMTAVFLNWEAFENVLVALSQSMGNLSSVPSTKQSKFKPTFMTCGEKGYAQIQMRLSSSETIPAKSVSLCSQKCKIQGIRWHVNEILRLQRRNESTWGRWWLTVSIPSITSGKGVWDFFYFLFKDCLMQNCMDESKYHHHKNRASSHSAFCQIRCTFLHRGEDSWSWVLVWERCLAMAAIGTWKQSGGSDHAFS